MKERFLKTTTSIIISSIIAFIIGLIMVAVPGISLRAIGITIGIFVIIYGTVLIALDFGVNRAYVPFYGIMSGILSIIVGLILIAMPNILPTVFAIALGIWIILSSINVISIAVAVKERVANWYLWLLLGIIDLVAGIIILFNPFESSISVVVLGGIIIMVHSLITIADTVMIRKDVKEVAKAIEANFKESKSSSTDK
ncbi:DUF308 domain-containing protein [Candidatus Saccharibacteria bacterium]|nr:DUF308 domain-containing protein [Candidatus Saccharibacteria bacterium]